MNDFPMYIPAVFGLEGVLADEMKRLGLNEVKAFDGGVRFNGGWEDMVRANIFLRCAQRVLIAIGEFRAETFDELFDNIRTLPLEHWIGRHDAFPVSDGHSIRSKLFSVRDCQSIIKKAAAERLKEIYKTSWMPEDGCEKKLRFSIVGDMVTLYLDSTGDALHKRGYRERSSAAAPLKETIAAALVYLSRFRYTANEGSPYRDILVDPMCGSGTIAIEAALMARGIAPGLYRRFLFEQWPEFDKSIIKAQRELGVSMIRPGAQPRIYAFDIDPKCVSLAKFNAQKARVPDDIIFEQRDARTLTADGLGEYSRGTLICNPPYGERLMGNEDVSVLYSDIGKAFSALPGFSCYVMTQDERFEHNFGRKSNKNRKIYNGTIKCYLYQYFK